MRRPALAVALALLLLAPAAHAKGTNVRISSAPNGTDAGEPWTTRITITMPGAGPLEGVRPKVVIRKGAARTAFRASPTARKGVYRARVVFPSRGRWRYGVDDGLDRFEPGVGRVHGFPAVTIGPGEPELEKPPLPVSGEIEEQVAPGPLDSPQGQLPPKRFSAPREDGGGSSAALPLLGFLVAAAVAGPMWLRRRRRGRR